MSLLCDDTVHMSTAWALRTWPWQPVELGEGQVLDSGMSE